MNKRSKFLPAGLLLASLALFSSEALLGETWAYVDPQAPSQPWPGNLGLDFTVNAPIVVTALGAFNGAGDGVVNGGPIQVQIFDQTTGNPVTPLATFTHGAGPNAGAYDLVPGGYDITQSIADTVLGPGNYTVVAIGFSSQDENGNVNISGPGPTENDGSGLITFTGARYDGNTSIDEPVSCVGCVVTNQFDAGTFEFEATPEPGTVGLVALGSLAMLVRLRSRRRA